MTKKASTDLLKFAICHVYGGTAEDWTRLSKRKNGEGQVVREFINKKSGIELVATETAEGKFSVKRTDAGAAPDECMNISLPLQEKPSESPIETDPAKNAAADKIMGMFSNSVPRELLEEAGKALANRYCFAMRIDLEDEGRLLAMITPLQFFVDYGHCDDSSGPIGHLLGRECVENMESTYEFCTLTDPLEAAQYLQQRGFVWDREFQDFVDASLTAQLESMEAPMEVLARQFNFVLTNEPECDEDGNENETGGLLAIITPVGQAAGGSSKEARRFVERFFPAANYVDTCMGGLWSFPAEFDTPAKLAKMLIDSGLVLDQKNQDPKLMDELKSVLKDKAQPAKKPQGPKI